MATRGSVLQRPDGQRLWQARQQRTRDMRPGLRFHNNPQGCMDPCAVGFEEFPGVVALTKRRLLRSTFYSLIWAVYGSLRWCSCPSKPCRLRGMTDLSPREQVYGLHVVFSNCNCRCVVRTLQRVVVDAERWCAWKARRPTRDAARAFLKAQSP
jgi:hypothetical protein